MGVPDKTVAQGAGSAGQQSPSGESWSYPTHVTRELAVILDPGSAMANSFTAIASQLQHMHVDIGVRSFCFIGDDGKTGTTVVAANVAAAFALSGQRTLLLETNLRSPRIAAMFGLDKTRYGLSEWLAGKGDIHSWSTYMQPAYTNLMVMPAGNALKEGEAYLDTEFRHLIIELSRSFDVVVCDAAPMTELAGTLSVVAGVERTIIVARVNRTRLNTLFQFQDIVKKSGGVIGGSVYLDF